MVYHNIIILFMACIPAVEGEGKREEEDILLEISSIIQQYRKKKHI